MEEVTGGIEQLCELIWSDNPKNDGIIYDLIIDNKIIINEWNSRGQTALYLAFRKANINVAKRLIEQGSNPKYLNSDGSSPVTGYLWGYLGSKNTEKYITFGKYFNKLISNSCDRRLVLDKNNKVIVEILNLDYIRVCPKFQIKYPDISFKCIGKYKTIYGLQGYYLYNEISAIIQCYSYQQSSLNPLIEYNNKELIYKFQSQFIIEKINYDIIDLLVGVKSYKIKNIPKIYITKGIADDIKNENNHNNYFMLPSQLNGAEYPDDKTIVKKFAEYLNDLTAGPAGQLAVHAGIGQFIIDNAYNDNNLNGINYVKYITNDKIKLVNGYLKVSKHGAQITNISDLMVMCIENIPVNGYDQLNDCAINKTHKVNIIYGSAIPINLYVNRYINNNLIEIANAILIGQYFGALNLVYKKGVETGIKQIIHLTLLGGGVFNNNKKDICMSIIKAIYILEQLHRDVNNFLEIKLQIFKDKQLANYYNENFLSMGL